MITELRLTNFKAFRNEQRIPLSRLNLIYGQNSSGKSTIIQGLLFLYAVTQRPGGAVLAPDSGIRFRILGQELSLPSIRMLRHRRTRLPVSLGYTVSSDESADATGVDFRWQADDVVTLSVGGVEVASFRRDSDYSNRRFDRGPFRETGRIVLRKDNPLVLWVCEETCSRVQEWLESTAGKKWLMRLRAGSPRGDANIPLLKELLPSIVGLLVARSREQLFDLTDLPPRDAGMQPVKPSIETTSNLILKRTITRASASRSKQPIVDLVVAQAWDLYRTAIENSFAVTYRELLHPAYIGPHRENFGRELRELPDFAFHWDEKFGIPGLLEVFVGIPISAERVALANRWLRRLRRADANFELRLKQVRSKDRKSMPAVEAVRLWLYDRGRKVEVDFADVGAGFSELMPILLTCVQNGPLTIIEQPELHLHPALQAEIGDLLIEAALRGKTGQVIAESHSEYLLLRVLRRIRESAAGTLPKGVPPITPDDVSLLYVDNLGTRSVVRRMPINERGELVFDWPAGFFEAGIREVIQ